MGVRHRWRFTVRNRTVDVDVGFSDLFDAVDIGGSFLLTANVDKVVFWSQVDYFDLDSNNLSDGPERARVQSEAFLATAAVGRQFSSGIGSGTIDLLGGVRFLNLENELDVGSASLSQSRSVVDGVVVIRPSFPLTKTVAFNPTFSVGAGDSDLTYELQPQIEYRFAEPFVARFGYRRLGYDYDGSGGGFDGAFHGFIFGVGAIF